MTRHSPAFEDQRRVPVADTVRDLVPDPQKDASKDASDTTTIKKFNFRKMLVAGAAVAVLSGAVWYGWDYWTVGRYLVSTDDAYVKADNTTVAPKVSGYLHQVLVGDNERVKAGQILARIDPRDFRVALDQAKADVAAARAAIASKQAQLEVQRTAIDAAKATIDVDQATVTDEATQQTEDQIGLDKRKRRDVQRRLTGLGFDTKVNGRFDKSTRAVITRWQAARGYPKTGFLNTLQHQALLTESVSAARASISGSDKSDNRPARRRGGGGVHHRRSGPGGLIGGVVGGLFGRR